MSKTETQERQKAWVKNFKNPRPGELDRVLACGGSDDNPHMVEMKMVFDATTPYGVCPNCGHRAFLHPRTKPDLTETNIERDQ